MSGARSTPLSTSPSTKPLPWMMAVAIFMETLDITAIAAVLPNIAHDLAIPVLQMKFAFTAYLISLAMGTPISGWLADRYGPKKVFCMAMGLFTLGSLGCAIATTLPMLVICRLLQGAGGSCMLPVARLVLFRTFPADDLLRVNNLATMPGLLGPMLGPPLGGLLASVGHWRSIFAINVPIGLVSMYLAYHYLPERPAKEVRPFDTLGFVLFTLGLGALATCMECTVDRLLPQPLLFSLLFLGVFCLMAYGFHAHRHVAPLLNLHLFHIRTFRLALQASTLCRIAVGGIPFLLPLMLQSVLQQSLLESGMWMAFLAACLLLSRRINVIAIRHLGFRVMLLRNTFALIVALALFALVPLTGSTTFLLLAIVCYSVPGAMQFSSLAVLMYVDVPKHQLGDGTSIMATCQQLAMGCGIAGVASLLQVQLGLHGDLATAEHAFAWTFFAMAGLCLLALPRLARLQPQDGLAASGQAMVLASPSSSAPRAA